MIGTLSITCWTYEGSYEQQGDKNKQKNIHAYLNFIRCNANI